MADWLRAFIDAIRIAVQNWRYRRQEQLDDDDDLMCAIDARWFR